MTIPGLGLDQSQLADVINQQYKGYSQKQRNQMMQSAAATPDNWSAITQQANQTATQPSEYLSAGRTSDVPVVTQNGQQLTGYDSSNLSSLYNMNSGYKDTPFDYTDSSGKGYYNSETQSKIESSAPNFLSGTFSAYTNPGGNFYDPREVKAGGYYYADPWGFSHAVSKVGNNKYFVSGDTLNEHTRSGTADTWYTLDQYKDLSGLSYGTNNGKEGLFFDPLKTNLSQLFSRQSINDRYADKKSGGFLGGLNKFAEGIAKWTDPVFYKSMSGGTEHSLWNDLTNEGLYGAIFNKMDPILDKLDPMHNRAQNLIVDTIGADSQKEAFNQVAPIVLAALTYGAGSGVSAGGAAVDAGAAAAGSAAAPAVASTGGSIVGSTASSIIQAAQAANALNSGDYAGAAMSGLNAANINPVTEFSKQLTSAGLTPAQAKMLGNFGVSSMMNLAKGQDLSHALAGSLFSTASGEAGSRLGDYLTPSIGEIAGKSIGGAASGGLNSLFNQNSPVNGSLFGAMSGGLHGFLNSTDRSNNTFNEQQNNRNRNTAQSVTKLAKLFTKK